MKKLLVAASLMLAFVSSQAQITFHEGDWASALAKAKTENKIIFVDAYTTWCGPCKMMAKNIFTLPAVGEVYNKHFVNMKIDMEKGEGVDLAQQFGVNVYPTFLFVGADGSLLHRGVGYQESASFIALAETAIDPALQLGSLKKRYASGDRSEELLYNLAKASKDAYADDANEYVKAYLDKQQDWSTPKNMEFIFQTTSTTTDPGFDYLLENQKKFEKTFGEEDVTTKIRFALNGMMQQIFESENPDAEMKKAGEVYKKALPKTHERDFLYFQMEYYAATEDVDKFAATTAQIGDKYGAELGSEELNSMAWSFYELVDDKAMLQKALGWAKASVAKEETYFNLDTLAALYYKLGNMKQAKKAAKKAIAKAKAEGLDYTETQNLLDQIK